MCVSLELYVCRAQGWQLETGSVGRVVKVRLKAGQQLDSRLWMWRWMLLESLGFKYRSAWEGRAGYKNRWLCGRDGLFVSY